MKFEIILPYYDRPMNIFVNAIKSIEQMDYQNWSLSFIDDGSLPKNGDEARQLIKDVLYKHIDKVKFYQNSDTPEQKLAQGGSRHGEFMNNAIEESDADVVVILCDDDALLPDYFTNLSKWFSENRHKKYCYSHIRPFDPEMESPFGIEKRPHPTNVYGLIHCSCVVDSSQVAYRRSCFTEGGVRYKSPQTKNLDLDMFAQLFDLYGHCHYTGFDSQYKGWFKGQLGNFTEQQIFGG